MAKLSSLITLVSALSRGEKKHFSMQTAAQNGGKDYLRLFQLILKGIPQKELKKEFLKHRHTASFETSCKYLYLQLTKSLIQLRQTTNGTNRLVQDMLKVDLFFEKSLYEEGFLQLQKIKSKAAAREMSYLQLWASSTELYYHNQFNFFALSEQDLIARQMEAEDLIRLIKSERQHHSLYELMKHRRLYKGTSRSAQQKAGLNDLVVSELGLMNTPPANSFQGRKAHLLFQSQYFLTTNDAVSALKIFYQLHKLFDDHKALWKNEPAEYIFIIEGILDSLRSIGQYKEFGFFLSRLSQLEVATDQQQAYIEKINYIYNLIPLLDRGAFSKAAAIVKKKKELLLKRIHTLDASQQAEVYLYTALTYFVNNQLKETLYYLRFVLLENKHFYNLPVYKTFRLIRLLAHHQSGDQQYVQYESRSLKRSLQKEKKSSGYLTEKLVLRFLQLDILPKKSADRLALLDKFATGIQIVRKDKYEMQLLKIFDFTLWIQAALSGRPFESLVKQKLA